MSGKKNRYDKNNQTVHKGLNMTHQILLCPEVTSCSGPGYEMNKQDLHKCLARLYKG